MEPWREGFLDIHHIATGRGNSVLMICPDGTSIMVDAGAVHEEPPLVGPARPDGSRRPGEWIGRYALQHLRATPRQELDYFVLTHFHVDHMGEVSADSPAAKAGDYKLTGVTDVAALLPVRRLLDRGYPAYDYPAPLTDASTQNYIRFAEYAAKHGTTVEQFLPGSHRQIALQHDAAKYPFQVQNLAANGTVWTGKGEESKKLFPDVSALKPEQMPTENACSIALRVGYGKFRYYIGGDLTCDTNFGTMPWMDVESAVAKVAGPVNVSALDHHGYYDATCPAFVRAMQSRVYVVQSWHATHPSLAVLNELYSPVLSPGAHDVFATGMVPAASVVDGRLSSKMLSQHGHVVVRVHPGGEHYEVFVLDDSMDASEEEKVLLRTGPYLS
jgi:beta-lactamase superfamily II metal-dependent hydrolase